MVGSFNIFFILIVGIFVLLLVSKIQKKYLKFIKDSLNNNPINFVELLSNMRSGDKKKFFEFAVNNNLKEQATSILRNKLTDLKFNEILVSSWIDQSIKLNKNHFYIYVRSYLE